MKMIFFAFFFYSALAFGKEDPECLFAAQNLRQGDLLFLEINNPILKMWDGRLSLGFHTSESP